MNVNAPFNLEKYGKSDTFNAFALSIKYGISNWLVLYPMIKSGSTCSTNSRHALSISCSLRNSSTSEPTMWAQVLRVKTLRMKGFDSPARGGIDERQRRRTGCEAGRGGGKGGRTLPRNHVRDLDDGVDVGLGEDTFPSRAFDIERKDAERSDVRPVADGFVRDESGVTVERWRWREGNRKSVPKGRRRRDGKRKQTYSHSTSYWQFDNLLSLCDHVPAFNSSQFIPTICRERMAPALLRGREGRGGESEEVSFVGS